MIAHGSRLLLLLSLSTLVTTSCAKPRPPAWTQPQPIEPHALPPAEDDPATRGPAPLANLGPVGCKIDTRGAPSGRALDLTVAPEAASPAASEPAKLHVVYETASFELVSGDARIAPVTLEAAGTKLGGFVPRDAVPLHARPSHKLVSGMLTPLPGLKLEIVGVDAGKVRARLPKLELLELGEEARVSTFACDELGATPFENVPPSKGKDVFLDVLDGLGLSPAPETAPQMILRAGTADASDPAIELEKKGKEVRVQIVTREALLEGWVPKAAVHPRKKERAAGAPQPKAKPRPDAASEAGSRAQDEAATVEAPKPTGIECKIALDVVAPARVGAADALVKIGEVHPGTVVVLDDDPRHAMPSPTWRAVILRGVTANVPLVVRAQSLETCAKRL